MSLHSKQTRPWLGSVVALALVYAGMTMLPNIWQRTDPNYPFAGIEIMGADQEQYYAARIAQVLRGDLWKGSVYLVDASGPPLQLPVPEWVIGGVGTLLHISVVQTFLFIKFLLSFCLFSLVTFCMARLSGSRPIGLLAASALLFAWYVFASPTVPFAVLTGGGLGDGFFRYARLIHPLFSSTVFFLILLLTLRWLDGPARNNKASLLIGFLLGFSFYVYPFTWTFLGVFFGLMILWFLCKRDTSRVYGLLIMGSAALLTIVPFVFHQLSIRHDPSYSETLQRLGLIASHAPIVGWTILSLFIFAFAVPRRDRTWFAVLLACAALITTNQQVMTGVELSPAHYHWYYVHPLSVLLLVVAFIHSASTFLQRFPRIKTGLYLVALSVTILCGYRYQRYSYAMQAPGWGESQHQADVLTFLATLPSSQVVYAPDSLQESIPLYTPQYTYFAGNSNSCCLTTKERLEDVYAFELWLRGTTSQEAKSMFFGERRTELSSRLYGIYYRDQFGDYADIPDSQVQEFVDFYTQYITVPLREKLQRHPMTVLVWPTNLSRTSALRSVLARGKQVYSDAWYTVWTL